MKKHKLAFVGAGRVADVHYASIQAMPDRAELVAVFDIRPEAVELRAREWNVRGFNSIEELLSASGRRVPMPVSSSPRAS